MKNAVKNWTNEFQCGRTSVFEEPYPGAVKMATIWESVAKLPQYRIGRTPI